MSKSEEKKKERYAPTRWVKARTLVPYSSESSRHA